MKFTIVLFLSLFSFLFDAYSANLGWGEEGFKEELQSDRPDFTEGTYVVQEGHLQVESGITYNNGDSEHGVTVPEILLRVGLVEKLEFRFTYLGYVEDYSDTKAKYGSTPYSLGLKFNIYEKESERLSIILESSIPGGSGNFYNSRSGSGGKLLYERDIDTFSMSSNLNLFYVNDYNKGESSSLTELAYSLAVSHEVYGPVSFYGEYFMTNSINSSETRDMFINGGFTYLVYEDLQFDIRHGVGLNQTAGSSFSGVGSVIRF